MTLLAESKEEDEALETKCSTCTAPTLPKKLKEIWSKQDNLFLLLCNKCFREFSSDFRKK